MISRREKKLRETMDFFFTGLEDDQLKEILLAIALEKSQEEKDALVEEMRRQNEIDYNHYIERYELVVHDIEKKSDTILDGEREPNKLDQGQQSSTLVNSNNE